MIGKYVCVCVCGDCLPGVHLPIKGTHVCIQVNYLRRNSEGSDGLGNGACPN